MDSFHRAGYHATLAATFADGFDLAAVATVYGTSTHQFAIGRVLNRPGVADRLRAVLGETLFDGCVATGAAMEPADAVRYARQQIQIARREIGDVS